MSAAAESRRTLFLCVAAALVEGFDTQSMGVAAPRLLPEFGLSPGQAAILFSATTLGLFVGAGIGGRFADQWGRHRTLAVSMLLFGCCSLLTAMAVGPASLALARVLTGLGLGAAMPNFIAMSSEAVHVTRRTSTVTVVMAGMPFGGVLAGLIALGAALGVGWRSIFYIGGSVPILLAALLWHVRPALRPEAPERSSPAAPVQLESVASALFGFGRTPATLQLWGAFFFTQVLLSLLLNWLPSLFIGLGHSASQASLASMCFNFCGAAGSLLLGRVHAGRQRRLWVVLTYAGMALAFAVLPLAGSRLVLALPACGLAGVFVVGAQLVLFALAPLYYPRPIRGTGVGAAVSIGRLGSVVGPLYAGVLLHSGFGSVGVLLGMLPFAATGGAAALALTWRRLA